MPQDMTRLKEKDYKLLKKENTIVLGESGGPYSPTFGNHINDTVKFHVYNMSDDYLKSGISENFINDGNGIKLNPGTDLRKIGFTRGNYKIKYYFYRRMAGSDEVVLTKNVGNYLGIVHSGNPQLTGLPMGAFYVDEDGKVYEGEGPPADGSPPSELDVKEYKFFIDDISSNRKEVRLAPQLINLNKYEQEFDSLSNMYEVYVPLSGVGSDGFGKFSGVNSTAFHFDTKLESDIGFEQKYKNGILEVENAFIVSYDGETNTEENPDWSLEDPIPPSYIEAYDLKDAGFPMSIRYVVKEESNQKTLGGHNFEGYTSIPNLTTPGIRYHFDFGCGHTEITDTPFANHTYDTVGSYNPTVTIMTPNFTEVISDVYRNAEAPQDGPGLRGSKLRGFVPTPEEEQDLPPEEEQQEQDTDLEYMPNGTIIRYYQTYWLIDGGKKRFIVSYGRDNMNIQVNVDDMLPVNVEGVYDTYAQSALVTLMQQKGAPKTGFPITGNSSAARNNRAEHSQNVNSRQWTNIPNGPAFTSVDFGAAESTAGGTPQSPSWPLDASWMSPYQHPTPDNPYPVDAIYGCMDPYANNYNPNAEFDDGSCTYDQHTITVESGPNGSATGGGTYDNGASVQLIATPNAAYEFLGWEDPDNVMEDTAGSDYTIVASKNAIVTAMFSALPTTYTVTISGGAGGTVSGGGTVYEGGNRSVHATPLTGFRIHQWGGAASGHSADENTKTFTNVTSNKTASVTFTLDTSGMPDVCFIAGTQITMSDGSMKNIEDIEVGDIVKSWNEEISQIENDTVIKLMSPIHDDIVKLTFGDVVNGNTFDHPYYVKGKGWCSYKPEWTMERYDIGQIGQLEVGDVCYYNNDSELEEIKLSHIKEELGEVQTYIFKVENNTFFANNILTHNK